MFRLAALVPWAIALAGAAYALQLVLEGGPVDASAAFVAGALVLAAELAYAAIDPAASAVVGLGVRGALRVALSAAGAVGVAGFVLVAAEVRLPAGLALEVLGVVAAVGAVALVAFVARRQV